MTRAIITDLDGTVLPRGGTVSPANLEAFRQAGRAGMVRIIATGRNLYAAFKALPQDFPIDYLIFSSGAGILRWSNRRMLFAGHIGQNETRQIAGYLWNNNINFTIQREIPDNHYFYYTSIYPRHEDYVRRTEAYAPFGSLIHSPSEIQGKASHFIVILDLLQLRLFEQIRSDLNRYSVVHSTSPFDNRSVWLEIFAPGIHKGSACRRLLQQLDIRPSDCAGLGNDYNDVDFLQLCGQAFLVANAPQRLKNGYKSVDSDQNNGFAEFISKVI